MLVVLDCETFSKYHFFNRHFVVHDNEKDVEMATWSVICLVESENTYQTAAHECIWLPDRYSEVCVKILMDKIKNFNVNMDVLSYMKRMKDDDILDLRARDRVKWCFLALTMTKMTKPCRYSYERLESTYHESRYFLFLELFIF